MMFLELLPDEALDSFCSRNLVYSQRWNNSAFFRKLDFDFSSKWSKKKIENLAIELGFSREYGYNFLLHYHTNYFRHAFVERYLDNTYGVGRFGGSLIIEASATREVKICPHCISEDILEHGFIYWKRSHQVFDVKVCSKHNLKLTSSCSRCSKPFDLKRHFFELPWSSCECGLSIFDLDRKANENLAELSLAIFISGLYEYRFRLEYGGVVNLIKNRLVTLGLNSIDEVCDKYCTSMDEVHFNVVAWNINEILKGRDCYVWGLPYVLAALFESFDSFAEAVAKENVRRVIVDAHWHVQCWKSAVAPRSAPFHSARQHTNMKTKFYRVYE